MPKWSTRAVASLECQNPRRPYHRLPPLSVCQSGDARTVLLIWTPARRSRPNVRPGMKAGKPTSDSVHLTQMIPGDGSHFPKYAHILLSRTFIQPEIPGESLTQVIRHSIVHPRDGQDYFLNRHVSRKRQTGFPLIPAHLSVGATLRFS